MIVKKEIDTLEDFAAWAGAGTAKKAICDAGKGEAFMKALEADYPDGINEPNLNDLLWFEPEYCLSLVGLQIQ